MFHKTMDENSSGISDSLLDLYRCGRPLYLKKNLGSHSYYET